MNRYSKYFLQSSLCLEDGVCRYLVQDRLWCPDEILDVPVVVYDHEQDAAQMLWACAEHNEYWALGRLREFLAEVCHGYHFIHRMADHEVVTASAGEMIHRAMPVVVEPGHGWAVKLADHADAPRMPLAVEVEPDLAPIFQELKAELDALVAEQRKKYEQYEAELAKLSEVERAAVYGKRSVGAIWDNTVGGMVDMVKALPGFYVGYLKILRKVAFYPSHLGTITAQCITSGSMAPLEAEFNPLVKTLAKSAEEAKKYTGILGVLLSDMTTVKLLHDFADRYYDATHPLELAEMGASASADIVVTILLAIFTAGVGAAANVAAKSARLAKVAKLLERLANVLKRISYRQRLPKKQASGGGAAAVAKKKPKAATKGGMPNPEKPKQKVKSESNEVQKLQNSALEAKKSALADNQRLVQQGRKMADQMTGDDRQKILAAADRLERNSHALEMARLADDVYNAPGEKVPPIGWRRLSNNPDDLPKALKNAVWEHKKSDFRAALYESEIDGSKVLSFRGTVVKSWRAWKNNFQQGLGLESEQYDRAMRLAIKAKKAFGDRLNITGHSLGGGLTSAGSIVANSSGYMFNSAGLHPNTIKPYNKILGDGAQLLHAYHVEGEVLTVAQSPVTNLVATPIVTPVKIVNQANPINLRKAYKGEKKLDLRPYTVPKAVGISHKLPAVDDVGRPASIVKANPVARHGMSYVINGIEQQIRVDKNAIIQVLGKP